MGVAGLDVDTNVVFDSRRKPVFLRLADLEELPAGGTPAFSRTWILVLTNLITLWIDGYSSLFSASQRRLDIVGRHLAANENNRNGARSGIRSDSRIVMFSSKTDIEVYRAARFSEFATGAAINLSIIDDANLRGLS